MLQDVDAYSTIFSPKPVISMSFFKSSIQLCEHKNISSACRRENKLKKQNRDCTNFPLCLLVVTKVKLSSSLCLIPIRPKWTLLIPRQNPLQAHLDQRMVGLISPVQSLVQDQPLQANCNIKKPQHSILYQLMTSKFHLHCNGFPSSAALLKGPFI